MPIVVVPAISLNDKTQFLCPKRQLNISELPDNALQKILLNCNGYNTIASISEKVSLDEEYVKKIICELESLGIVCDSCKQYRHFHNISNNPQIYPSKLTLAEISKHKENYLASIQKGQIIKIQPNQNSSLYRLQSERKSCRNFSSEKKLSKEQIGNICDYAYSLKRHAVPSGGALYPLRLICVIPEDEVDIKAGYYEYDALNENLIFYNEYPDAEQLKYCYNEETVAFNSPLQIIICADLERQGLKYGNLGYRLTLIEVGQVAQNISLYCAEQGLCTCELGGILNEELAVEIGLEDEVVSPILAIAVGYESQSPKRNMYSLYTYLLDKYVGYDNVIYDYGIHSFDQKTSFFGAWARFGVDGKLWAGATGTSYFSAVSKALMEAYERYRSACVRVDYVGPANDTGTFILPDEIAPLSNEQRKRLNLIEYNKTTSIEWTKDCTGQFFLPTDFVFYGHNKSNKLFRSTSSGVAAHTEYAIAKEKALLELIERDAIMRLWYSQKSPMHFNSEQYSQHIRNRMAYWKKQGRDVYILSLDSPYLPVYLVVIVGENYPCFVSGAATSLVSAVDAIEKALQEAEYNLFLNKMFPCDECPDYDEIHHPVDHGRFYHYSENAKKIQWIWSNDTYEKNILWSPIEFDYLCELLNVIFVDLSDESEKKLKVVRAISTKLVPISFGYGSDYYNHTELKDVRKNSVMTDIPHFFA